MLLLEALGAKQPIPSFTARLNIIRLGIRLAYARYMLEPTAEELRAWEIAKSNPLARTMTIRDISCAIPSARG
jgi:hypothetical protein